jgi:hypothetical protein
VASAVDILVPANDVKIGVALLSVVEKAPLLLLAIMDLVYAVLTVLSASLR